jgi:hypothetical protein
VLAGTQPDSEDSLTWPLRRTHQTDNKQHTRCIFAATPCAHTCILTHSHTRAQTYTLHNKGMHPGLRDVACLSYGSRGSGRGAHTQTHNTHTTRILTHSHSHAEYKCSQECNRTPSTACLTRRVASGLGRRRHRRRLVTHRYAVQRHGFALLLISCCALHVVRGHAFVLRLALYT